MTLELPSLQILQDKQLGQMHQKFWEPVQDLSDQIHHVPGKKQDYHCCQLGQLLQQQGSQHDLHSGGGERDLDAIVQGILFWRGLTVIKCILKFFQCMPVFIFG